MAGDERVGLHTIKPPRSSRRARKRVGRGEGSGSGKTAGRGQKGAGARSGNKKRARFERALKTLKRELKATKKSKLPLETRAATQATTLPELVSAPATLPAAKSRPFAEVKDEIMNKLIDPQVDQRTQRMRLLTQDDAAPLD